MQTYNNLIQYNIFKHESGVRVIEPKSGRKGLVKEIRETGYEWISPFVQWDDGEFSYTDATLYLESEEVCQKN